MTIPASSDSASGAFRDGFLRCMPAALGVFAYGLVFGALTRTAGMGLGEAAAMSAIIFSGSAQFVALGIWTLPPPTATLALATLLINFRFFLMAATMPRVLRGWPLRRALPALFWVTDENWAVTMAAGERPRWGAFFLGTGVALYLTWLATTVIGNALGSVVADPKAWGLDFAFPAMFMALAVGLARKAPAPLVWIASAGAALIADRLVGGNAPVLVGGLAGAAVAAMRKPERRHAP